MHQFVVVDHSIKRIGGHNYEYAFHILTAAERESYSPVLAVNRRFFERARLPASWRLCTAFRHTTYECHKLRSKQRRWDPKGEFSDCAVGNSSRQGTNRNNSPGWLPGWFRRGMVKRCEMQRRSIIARYTEDMAALFRQMSLQRGDQVFLPTLSEDDLMGLLAFFRIHRCAASDLDWHLQFHFKLYDGRETDYGSQDGGLVELKQLLHDIKGALPAGNIHFYTTTDILAAQFARLGATVAALPYPVNPALLQKPAQSRRLLQPLRVTCAGAVRAEKGSSLLHRAIAPLWKDYFENRRLQLVVQAKRIGKLPVKLKPFAGYDGHAAANDRNSEAPKVALVRWPLSTEQYLQLIRQSHIGLFLYDADEYYARCSGVMVEMLKAAVPVIVPAGCWMAEQISEAIFAYRDRLVESSTIARRMTAADAVWEPVSAQRYQIWRPDARLLVDGAAASLSARLDIPTGATHLCIRFRWAESTQRGNYLALAASQFSDAGSKLSDEREVVGLRGAGRQVPMLISLAPQARRMELQWRNAFGKHAFALENLEFLFLSAGADGCPLGAVGLIAAGIDQVPRLLRDMADHYEHYRRTAAEFAPAWGQWHSPERVVRLLTQAAQPDARQHRSAA